MAIRKFRMKVRRTYLRSVLLFVKYKNQIDRKNTDACRHNTWPVWSTCLDHSAKTNTIDTKSNTFALETVNLSRLSLFEGSKESNSSSRESSVDLKGTTSSAPGSIKGTSNQIPINQRFHFTNVDQNKDKAPKW